MKQHKVLPIILLVSLIAVGSAFAHLGETKLMFQFPDALIPELDGELSDWDIVGDAYRITADNMFNQFSAPLDLSDFNSWIAWGYNLNTGRAYLGVWFFDDMIHGTEHWSVEVDWDHTGDQYRAFDQGDDFETRWINGSNQKYDVAAPAQDPSGFFIKMSGKAWAAASPFVEWAGQFLSGAENTFEPAQAFVELSFMPFDDVHPDGIDQSKVHTFQEGAIVGIEVNRGDKDADPSSYDDAYWSSFGGINAWKFGDQLGDYLLAPVDESVATAVEASTWGQIKSSFAGE